MARSRHPGQTDLLFSRPLDLLRSHCVPFAVQKSYKQMESSVFYCAHPITHLPDPVSHSSIDNSSGSLIRHQTENVSHISQTSTLSPDEAERLMAESEVASASFIGCLPHLLICYPGTPQRLHQRRRADLSNIPFTTGRKPRLDVLCPFPDQSLCNIGPAPRRSAGDGPFCV